MPEPAFDQLLRFFKALGNESRLKIVGILANREATVGDLADLLDLREPTVSHHLTALKEVGLVQMRAEGNAHVYALDERGLLELRRDIFSRAGMASLVKDVDRASWKQKILQTFVIEDRLTQIPAQRKKRLVIVQWLARKFELGMRYPERELNEIIKRYHPDAASLRRALVSWKFMAREGGVYWRVPEVEQLRALAHEVTGDENVLQVLRGE
jgi:DNA-binding transcriptional ArsR family regulator